MRPMRLFESGHSSGEVSLANLLDGKSVAGGSPTTMTVPGIIERIVVGGWPETINLTERSARTWIAGYLRDVAEVDVPAGWAT